VLREMGATARAGTAQLAIPSGNEAKCESFSLALAGALHGPGAPRRQARRIHQEQSP